MWKERGGGQILSFLVLYLLFFLETAVESWIYVLGLVGVGKFMLYAI